MLQMVEQPAIGASLEPGLAVLPCTIPGNELPQIGVGWVG